MTTFIIDIDGTLCEYHKRIEVAGTEPERGTSEHAEWLTKIQRPKDLIEDKPIAGMSDLVWGLKLYSELQTPDGIEVVYLTARNEKLRTVTMEWLAANNFPTLNLFMRPEHETIDNHELKRSIIRAFRGNKVVIDDDPNGKLAEVCLTEKWTFLKAVTYR